MKNTKNYFPISYVYRIGRFKYVIMLLIVFLLGIFFLNKIHERENKPTAQSINNCKDINSSQAIDMIQNLKEVKDYLSQNSNAFVGIATSEGQDTRIYMVQLANRLSDHNSVHQWYTVNKCTGEIVKTSF